MKKKILLLCAVFFVLFAVQDVMAQSEQTECISVEQDGSQTLRVWGKGRNRVDAVEQAKKNAVYEVLFTDHTAEYRYVIDAQTGRILDHTSTLTDPES